MISLLTGGGLGDAAMALAKLYGKFNPKDISLTHVEPHLHLLSTIREFYKSQEIKANVCYIDSWEWKNKHEKEFEMWIETGWNDGWEINPFPPLKYNRKQIDILVNPFSGRNASRGLSQKELLQIDSDKVTYVGTTGEAHVSKLVGRSLIGKTTIKELVDLVCSSNKIITSEGFVAYIGAMAGKEVWVKNENIKAIKKRKHPLWDFNVFDDVGQIS